MNLCIHCEQKMHSEKSEKWCLENGLNTVEKRIAFCRAIAKKWWPSLPASWGKVERVPGEDDEEHAVKEVA